MQCFLHLIFFAIFTARSYRLLVKPIWHQFRQKQLLTNTLFGVFNNATLQRERFWTHRRHHSDDMLCHVCHFTCLVNADLWKSGENNTPSQTSFRTRCDVIVGCRGRTWDVILITSDDWWRANVDLTSFIAISSSVIETEARLLSGQMASNELTKVVLLFR